MFGVNDTDGERVYVDSDKFFEKITDMMPIEDTGLYFHDEIEVGEGVSVITDERVSIGSPDKTVRAYKKVVEMVELNELEIQQMNKVRLLLKKLFEVFFKGKKGLVIYTAFLVFSVGLDIVTRDLIGLILNIALICMWNQPIKFYRELKKIFTSEKKYDALCEDLKQLGLLNVTHNVTSKDAVKLYYKPRVSR